jgi:hypothetical protein
MYNFRLQRYINFLKVVANFLENNENIIFEREKQKSRKPFHIKALAILYVSIHFRNDGLCQSLSAKFKKPVSQKLTFFYFYTF